VDTTIDISVQGQPHDAVTWRELAVACEHAGFDALLVADHPGTCAEPFVALAAAAAVTSELRLGSYVVNAGVRDPLELARATATLDVVSDGRAFLGLGAGHTPAEWQMLGRTRPPAGARVERLVEVTDTTMRLLAGETVDHRSAHVQLHDARLETPLPLQHPVPLLVGGNGPRVLAHGARVADVVALSGTGRTLEDGHHHEVLWRGEDIDRRVGAVHAEADGHGRSPRLEALVQHVEVTPDAEAAAARIAQRVTGDVEASDILACPYIWLGTTREIADAVRAHHERWGFDRHVVRPDAMETAGEVLALLR
jgi:probable F420-dependent oxidoreductase